MDTRRCVWIERDENGRPRCEHGWALDRGRWWGCPRKRQESYRRYESTAKARARQLKYEQSEKGRARAKRYRETDYSASSKRLNELTRVR